ncbi:MAG: polymer-forming cytoskeletal protein [Planctomycetota bacterium]|jgi:cytoskeletal protein CcmA (bactofilin family)
MTTNCRHCNRRVMLEDLKIKAYHAVVRLETAGKLEIQTKAHVVAEVRVNELTCKGKVRGNITCLGPVRLHKKAEVIGDISCRSLKIEGGAVIDGFVTVDPEYQPQPPREINEEVDDGLLRRPAEDDPEPPAPSDEDTLLKPKTRKAAAKKKAEKKTSSRAAKSE